MKRFWVWCVLLCLSVQLLVPWGKATETVCFTAANELLLDLTDETMPFWQDGELYVSQQVFQDGLLGVNFIRSRDRSSALLYRGSDVLICSLQGAGSSDNHDQQYSRSAVERGGIVFFPISLLTEYFGLRYSYTETSWGQVLRLKSDAAVLSDQVFLDAAGTLLAYRYQQYSKSKETTSQLVTVPQETTPAVTPKEDEEERVTISLALRVSDADALGEVLRQRETLSGLTLFVPETILQTQGDLLRCLYGKGYTIAAALTAETGEELLREAERCNALLLAHGLPQSRLLCGAEGAEGSVLRENGYWCARPQLHWSRGFGTNALRTKLLRAMQTAGGYVLIEQGEASAEQLRQLLLSIEEDCTLYALHRAWIAENFTKS